MQNCYRKPQLPPSLLPGPDQRLTPKHLQALSFLQDLGAENKALNARIDELEEHLAKLQSEAQKVDKCSCHEDEVSRQLQEKHQAELMQKVEEKVEAERRWEEEKRQFVADLEAQRNENDALRRQIDASKKDTRVAELETRLTALQEEAEQVAEQKAQLEQVNGYQLEELSHLGAVREHNEQLHEQLSEVIQKNKELGFTVQRLERDLADSGQTELEDLMDGLRAKLSAMHREKTAWAVREADLTAELAALRAECGRLRRALADSERMRGEVRAQFEEALDELEVLKARLASGNNGQAFREFVQLKRELARTHEENVELRERLKTSSTTPTSTKAKSAVALPNLGQGACGGSGGGVMQSARPVEKRVKPSNSLASGLGRR